MRVFQVVWDFIAGSLLTTLGDIVKRGAAVNERMPVGNAHEVLKVNSAGDDLGYSVNNVFYVGGIGVNIAFKILEIGAWSMDGAAAATVAHGLTHTTIRNVTVLIRNDADTMYYNIHYWDGAKPGGWVDLDNTNVYVHRVTDSFFDHVDFDAVGGFNRGWITIQYEL